MRLIRTVFDWVFAALAWFAFLLLAVMTALVFADVFCRYLLHFSIAWADEICLIFLVWYVFIALAIGVRRKVHTSIDLVSMIWPNRTLARVLERLVSLLVLTFGGLLCYFGTILIKVGSLSTLASVDIPSSVEYVFIPVSGALVMYSALAELLRPWSAEPGPDYLDSLFLGKVQRHV
jgi:TRAP-type C4-dicarboxylate transport system permease small subunit